MVCFAQIQKVVERSTCAAADAPCGHAAAFGAILRCVDALVASASSATAAVLTAAAGFASDTVRAW